ncbi:MAG: acyl-CoA dehydrogenase family protein [Robiginitomaculum sp.]|nr:acyl-CoA dehydrogenase family protein [Robiginitomaculum sp.]
MALLLNEDEKMLQESAQGFFAEKAPVSQLRTLRDNNDEIGFSKSLWKEMAEMGFTSVLIPEEYSGVDMGFMAAGLISEEMGRNLTASPFLSSAVLAVEALKAHGNTEQKSKHLPSIGAGKTLFALAIDESNKHNPAEISLTATPSGNGFKLNGYKTMVVDGHVANHIMVIAKTDESMSVFIVPNETKGVEIERTIMADSRNAARISFDDVEVTGEQILGNVGDGDKILDTVLNAGRAILAAEMLGASSQVFEHTNTYLRERKQFGKIIGEFQALQHRASHLYCELELARSAVFSALTALDDGADNAGAIVGMAKAKLGSVAKLAALEAVQLHGGMGMTDELDIGLYLKRIRVAQELLGDSDFHLEQSARHKGY